MERIIICDDDADDLSFMEEAFVQLGVKEGLVLFDSGEEFLKHLHSTTELPKLVILDYNMPVLTGEAVMLEMKEHPNFAAIKVVILSTGMHKELENRLLDLGAYCCIAKPYTPDGYLQLAKQLKKIATDLDLGLSPDLSGLS